VLAPFVAAERWLALPLLDPLVAPLLLLVVRALSAGLLLATFVLTFDLARTLADRRTAVMTVALLALAPVVVYFGPLANLEVPHLFWVTASWWAWIAFWRYRDLASGMVFGAIVGVSMGVKDQAYAFYVAAPVAIAYLLWHDDRERSLAGVVRDPRLWAIGIVTVAAFAIVQGMPWAWDRFRRHLEVMTTDAMLPFQMFAQSPEGYLQLLGAIGKTMVWAAGVPLAAVFVAGIVEEIMSRRGARLALLMMPVATYLVAFLGVTMYVYDRFLIACLPMVAFVGGRFSSGLTRQRGLALAIRAGIPAAILAVAAINAIGQNLLFHGDARSDATWWIARNIPCGSRIGVAFDTSYIPALGCFDVQPIRPGDIATTAEWPEYFVFNDLYVRRFLDSPSGSEFLQRLHGGKLGYRVVFHHEASVPRWVPLLWEQRFRNNLEDPETTLDKPINAITVWKRE
jgi:4-amino-4-deoxy-L-arabinose transferase-like glycosyltransferase